MHLTALQILRGRRKGWRISNVDCTVAKDCIQIGIPIHHTFLESGLFDTFSISNYKSLGSHFISRHPKLMAHISQDEPVYLALPSSLDRSRTLPKYA